VIKATPHADGAVLHLTLSRPKANILDAEMIRGIRAALEEGVRAHTALVVFEGAGAHFSFGASVEEHRADAAAGMLEEFHGLFADLARLAVPTCAVVRGQCLGGGLELASWCTWIVVTPDARLGQPEIKLAVFPPMASVLLPWRVGGAAAMDLCVSGRSVGADEALQMGLIQAISEDPEAWWRARFDKALAKTSAASLRFAERAVRADLMARMARDLPALERLYLDELMATHDANEGIEAFITRRPATFTHS
jgi:cyclohexa-1,5-dienecarbonyl-CoA hydratase